MKELEIRTTMISVNSIDRSIGDETATDVKIVDEGAGEFVEVIQYYTDRMPDVPTIRIDPEEWPALRDAINKMVKECRKEKL